MFCYLSIWALAATCFTCLTIRVFPTAWTPRPRTRRPRWNAYALDGECPDRTSEERAPLPGTT